VLRVGLFHADPHPGNIFAFRDGSLGLIDFGAVGRLDPIQQAAVVDILAALMRRDVSLLRDGIERVAEVHNADRPEELERALARLLADHVRVTGAVDPSVLQDLVAMLARFGIRLPTDLVVLSRALVTLDGTLRVLAPEMSLVTAATESMTSATAPAPIDRDEMIRDEMLAALPHLRRLPDRIDRILTLTSRGELRVRSIVDEDPRRILRTLVNRALLVATGTAFLAVAAVLLVAADPGPAVGGGAGLFEVFGYFGLFVGTVLLLRVVAAVTRDGTT
jgi:ubiquinone biosynthesis protein